MVRYQEASSMHCLYDYNQYDLHQQQHQGDLNGKIVEKSTSMTIMIIKIIKGMVKIMMMITSMAR